MPDADSARRPSLFSSMLLCVPMAACSIYADLPEHRGDATGPTTGGAAGATGGAGVTGGATSTTGQGGSSGAGGQGGISGTSGEGGSGGAGGSGAAGASGMGDASADRGQGATGGAGGKAGAGGAGAGGHAGAAGGSSGGAAGSVVADGGPKIDSAGAAGASSDGSSAGGSGGAGGSSGTAGSAGKAGSGGSGGSSGAGGSAGSADAGSKDAPSEAGGLCSTGACKRVFVSSSSPAATGAFGGLVAADSFCQSSADAKQLGGTWKAWLSTSSTTASARLAHATVPYRLLDGSTVAGDWAGLTSGTLSHTINVTEAGVVLPGSTILEVWTGTTAAGAFSGDTCNGWTDGSATPTADVGLTSETGSGWTAKYLQYCNRTNLRLYCFEQ